MADLTKEDAQKDAQELFNYLEKRRTTNNSPELLDIMDVLLQVIKNISSTKNPAALVNRLVNYIRSIALASRIHFSKPEEDLIIKLEIFGQKAGLNGAYMADFSDKSYFYKWSEEVPNRH
jgi:hypothetical protein